MVNTHIKYFSGGVVCLPGAVSGRKFDLSTNPDKGNLL